MFPSNLRPIFENITVLVLFLCVLFLLVLVLWVLLFAAFIFVGLFATKICAQETLHIYGMFLYNLNG